jgi:hypothetical protein
LGVLLEIGPPHRPERAQETAHSKMLVACAVIHCAKKNGADFCVTRQIKIGGFVIIWADRTNYSRRLKSVICLMVMTSAHFIKKGVLPLETLVLSIELREQRQLQF